MAISEAMLAQAVLEYFEQHAEEFEKFLLNRYRIDNGYVSWGEDIRNQRLRLTATRLAQSGEIVSERDYHIRIEI